MTMKIGSLGVVLLLAISACGRQDAQAPRARIDEAKQAEKAAEAGKPLSDASLTQIVKSALQSESSLNAQKIDVENRNGNVALHGVVASEEQKEKAARIVAAVGGVKSVANNLAVDPAVPDGASAGATSATILQRKD